MNNFTQVEKGECLLKFLPEGMATVEKGAYFRAATMGEVRFAAGTLHFKADLVTWCADSFCIEAGGVIKFIPDLHVLNEIPGGMFGVTFGQSSGPKFKTGADFTFAKPSASHNLGVMKIIKGSQAAHDYIDQQGFNVKIGVAYHYVFAMPGPDVTVLVVEGFNEDGTVQCYDVLFKMRIERAHASKLWRPLKHTWKAWERDSKAVIAYAGESALDLTP